MCSHSHEEFLWLLATNRKHALLHVRLFFQSDEAFIFNINTLLIRDMEDCPKPMGNYELPKRLTVYNIHLSNSDRFNIH